MQTFSGHKLKGKDVTILNYNISDNIWIFLYSFLNTFPFIPLRYYCFRNKLRISFKKIMLIKLIFAIIQGMSFVYLIHYTDSNHNYVMLHNTFFAIFFIVLSCFFIKDSLIKILYIPSLLASVIFFTFSVPITIDSIFNVKALTTPSYIISVISRIIIIALLYPFLYRFMKKFVQPIMDITVENLWKNLFIIPGIFCVLEVLNTRYLFTSSYGFVFFLIRLVIMVCCFSTTFVIINVIKSTAKQTELEENEKHMKILLEMEMEQYSLLSNNIEKTRIARHDLRHHLTYVKSLADNNCFDDLKNYLNNYLASLPIDKPLELTKNIALNSICSHYINLAETKNINVTYKFSIPEKLSICDNDLCIIAGNSIENAIEACYYVKDTNKFINICIKLISNNLSIIISNSFDGKIKKTDNNLNYISRKRKNDECGIGISSICAVIEKYNGMYDIDIDNNIFTFKMLIPCKEKA